jgi:hypothetical protein
LGQRSIWSIGCHFADAVVADWHNVLIGVRQDVRFDFSNSAIIRDDTGAIVKNMWQQDAMFMRATMRVGSHLTTPGHQPGTAGTPVPIVTTNRPIGLILWTRCRATC